MNAPHDLGPDFRSWLRNVPPMPDELPARTLDQTRHTRQRRRWLWFLPGRKPTAGADEQATGAQPIPTIESTGGTRTMFSATKLVGIAAAVALFGALMLAVPFGSQDTQTPAAPASEAAPEFVIVEGRGSFGGQGNVMGHTQMSDPRVSGEWDITQEMVCSTVDAWACAKWGQATLSNEGGTWQGEWAGFHEPITVPGLPLGQHDLMAWLEGAGDYEGLSFVATLTGDPAETVARGLIYEGPIPPTLALGAVVE